ncbi:predicted protein [Uncinocarpus reesii 1704]|uniref:Uncharacterized protein n=1 Tax=Uncinocarpus reesii (strain UAMH 1704) TaxID=336963 RepID=C4JV62_UNCRE|nr:uncharacterized protein UREG_06454 [Uncinocarpus reesii 1704]EEP81589.1 predicted protein [Uncinocarpus reesii 1704]
MSSSRHFSTIIITFHTPRADGSLSSATSSNLDLEVVFIDHHQHRLGQYPDVLVRTLNSCYHNLQHVDIEDEFESTNAALFGASPQTMLSVGSNPPLEPASWSQAPAGSPERPRFEVITQDWLRLPSTRQISRIRQAHCTVECANEAVMDLVAMYHGGLLDGTGENFVEGGPASEWCPCTLRQREVAWWIDPVDATLQLSGCSSDGHRFRVYARLRR